MLVAASSSHLNAIYIYSINILQIFVYSQAKLMNYANFVGFLATMLLAYLCAHNHLFIAGWLSTQTAGISVSLVVPQKDARSDDIATCGGYA